MPIRTDCDIRRRYRLLLAAVAVAALWIGDVRSQPAADLLLVGGLVHDGSGQPPGRQEMLERFRDPETVRRLDVETREMLAIRGGADKLLFADPRPELNGRTLAAVAAEWELSIPAAVRRIITVGNAAVMNLDLYDIENTRYLARQPWMMTCTDGRTPSPTQNVTHPRVFGAFTRKLRQFVLDERIIAMPFAIRSMTGLAADFLHLDDRVYLRAGAIADIAVFDGDRIRDRATYDQPRQPAEGTVHVLVNGRFAIRDGDATGALAGQPIRRTTRTGGITPDL